MAIHLRKRGIKWCAEVRYRKNRATKTFETKREAKVWAEQKQQELYALENSDAS